MRVTRAWRYASQAPFLQNANRVPSSVLDAGFLVNQFSDVLSPPTFVNVLLGHGMLDGVSLFFRDFGRTARPLFSFQASQAVLLIAFFPEIDFAVCATEVIGGFAQRFFIRCFDHEQTLPHYGILDAFYALFDLGYGFHEQSP